MLKLKSVIKCSTMELLKMLDNNRIVYTEVKEWHGHYPSFQEIADDLNQIGIPCQVEVRARKRDNT